MRRVFFKRSGNLNNFIFPNLSKRRDPDNSKLAPRKSAGFVKHRIVGIFHNLNFCQVLYENAVFNRERGGDGCYRGNSKTQSVRTGNNKNGNRERYRENKRLAKGKKPDKRG